LHHTSVTPIYPRCNRLLGSVTASTETNCSTINRSAKPERIDSFLKLISPFGILESARTGLMALPRSPLYGPHEESTEVKEADDIVDASQLPPG